MESNSLIFLRRIEMLNNQRGYFAVICFRKMKKMTKIPFFTLDVHTFNFSVSTFILSFEDKRYLLLLCIFEFILSKWSMISLKFANLESQLQSQNKSQNSHCFPLFIVLKIAGISSFGSYTRDNAFPCHIHLAPV